MVQDYVPKTKNKYIRKKSWKMLSGRFKKMVDPY